MTGFRAHGGRHQISEYHAIVNVSNFHSNGIILNLVSAILAYRLGGNKARHTCTGRMYIGLYMGLTYILTHV